jgi:GxxExxY protein
MNDIRIKRILTHEEELIAKDVVDSAFKVHNELGPGLLEKIYQTCFCHELTNHGLSFQRQVKLPFKYDNIMFD